MKEKEVVPSASSQRIVRMFHAIGILALCGVVAYFVYTTSMNNESRYPFKLGLDLAGGSHLVYEADVSGVAPTEVADAMGVLRDVIERRTNVFGVSEPIVQVEQSSVVAGEQRQRLVVELPGVTDIDTAIKEIGKTPLLEFKLVDAAARAAQEAIDAINASNTNAQVSNVAVNGQATGDPYISTGLTGRYLTRATLEFGSASQGGLSNEAVVRVDFNEEGAELFAQITRDNVGRQLAIFLDGVSVSEPVIRESITGGTAVISGNFTPTEARELVKNLNFGALPIPIELVSTQTIGASLGEEAWGAGLKAGMVGLLLVVLFMVLWYRLPGLIASIALVIYLIITIALIKLIPVTLTASGIAALILSIGMAVDANVLIFERMKEELRGGKEPQDAVSHGFSRAWPAIRDGHLTMLISSIILFWMGTSLVKGFALVFGLGVLTSLFTAVSITRMFLRAVVPDTITPLWRKLLEAGMGHKTDS